MVVALYFTNWSIYARGYSPAKLPVEYLSHVIYAFAKTNPLTGTVSLSDPWADTDKPMDLGGHGCLGELQIVKQQRNSSLRVLLSIGGWSYRDDLTAAFSSESARYEFARSAAELVRIHGLDGLDIDWEFPDTPEKGNQLVHVLELCRRELDTQDPSLDLTVAAPASPAVVNTMPLRTMDRLLSFWNLMTYDFSGPWSPVAAHQANLWPSPYSDISADSVVSQYERGGIHVSRLVLGMPLYGRSFANCKGFGKPFQGTLEGKYEAGMHDLRDLPLEKSVERVDEESGTALCEGPGFVVTYDTAEVAVFKARYVRSRGLAGGMWWEASGDRYAPHSVVQTFATSLQ